MRKFFEGKSTAFKAGLVVALLFVLVFLRWGSGKIGEIMRGKYMAQAMIPKVTLGEIKEAQVSKTLEVPGRVVAKYSVDLIARVDGYLQKSHFKEGDFVKKGQVLFTIEPSQYTIASQKAQAELKSAQAQSKKAEVDFKRAKELVEKDFISKAAYDDRLAQRDVARANVQSATAALNDARRNYNYTKIASPTDGKIGSITITQGNYVSAQSGALARVVSMNPIYVLYSLDSKQFNELRNDTILPTVKQEQPIKVELTLADGTIYKYLGKEDFYGNEISATTGTIDLRATFENPENILIPGDFVKVKIYSNTLKNQVIVPQSATLQDTSGKYVYTLDEKNKAKMVRIETEGQYENNWIVSKGLKAGDKIIEKGALKVVEGAQVKILSEDEYKEQEAQQEKKEE